MNKVLHWIRSNVAIVVLAAVILLALILGPIFSERWNRSVREEAAELAKRWNEMESLQKTAVTVNIPGQPPVTLTTVVNPYLLTQYERLTNELRDDAAKVSELAVTHNRKGRGVLIPRLFPRMPDREADTLPPEMHQVTLDAYEALLRQIRAGEPPSHEAVAQTVLRREEQFINNTLRKRNRGELDDAELKDLTDELTRARLAAYGEVAQSKGVYATVDALPIPTIANPALATMAQMFQWQWDYWVTEDVLAALHDANVSVGGPQGAIVVNPVKRIVSIRLLGSLPIQAPAAGGGRGATLGGGPSLGGGGATLGGGGGGRRRPPTRPAGDVPDPAAGGVQEEVVVGGEAIDPAREAPLDFAASFTGRVSNHLYDVRYAEVRLIVSAEALPLVLDALARRNFFTVVDVDARPADLFEAAADGFIYGSEPVLDVTLTLETVWLREWTAPFMPVEVRRALRIASPQVGQPSGGASDGQAG